MEVTERKKILVTTSTFPRWKDDTDPPFVYELCKRLVKLGIDVDVLAPHTKGAKSSEIMEGVNVYRYKYFFEKWQTLTYSGGILANLRKNKLNYLLIPFFMGLQGISEYRLIRKYNYSVIHAHWIIPQGLISVILNKLSGKRIPLLCTSHGGDFFSMQSQIFRKIKLWIIKNSEQLTVVSSYMRDQCVAMHVGETKVSVCPMGVDLVNEFLPKKGISRNANSLVFVGRLVEKKGISCLIESVSELIPEFPSLSLCIVGDGPLKKKLIHSTRTLGIEKNVKFIGAVPHKRIPDYLSSSAIAVIPSIIDNNQDQEGLGLTIIEAMGCGCAVIASSLGAIKDIIDEGENGLLVRPGDAKDLTEKISRLLNDQCLRVKIGNKGQESVNNRFDWRVASQSYCDLINELAN